MEYWRYVFEFSWRNFALPISGDGVNAILRRGSYRWYINDIEFGPKLDWGTRPKIEVSKMSSILDRCNQPNFRLSDIHSAILLSVVLRWVKMCAIMRRCTQFWGDVISRILDRLNIGSFLSRCPQNWGDIAVVLLVYILVSQDRTCKNLKLNGYILAISSYVSAERSQAQQGL